MTEAQALEAIGILAGTTTGWTDESVENYCRDLMTLDDGEILAMVTTRLAQTWTEARRPPLAEIRNLYHREAERVRQRRRVMALPSYANVMTPEEGIEVARRAYESECRHLGRAPRMERFDAIMRAILP